MEHQEVISSLSHNAISCIENTIILIRTGSQYDLVVTRLESLLVAVRRVNEISPLSWGFEVSEKLELVITLLINSLDNEVSSARPVGRPKIEISISNVEYLLSLKFKVTVIADILGVSTDTIFRRLRASGISVRASYSNISNEDLHQKIVQILTTFPNTGYKRMKGFLLAEGLKLTDQRVRESMRLVDPAGVYQRTLSNRAIVRRQYNVEYFNQLWHLDTNMKLIRWNIVIRSCIDGKTRLVVYLDASGDNRAETNCASFLKAVAQYGIPYRTRSDKGGENVLIARFMIEQRGVNRASHICGRSVHNQRIERYWRDVFFGYTGALYNVFMALESDGYLDVDSPKHIEVLHRVFLPRMNKSMETFRHAWNSHPLSSERNYSPVQLMMLTLPPESHDLALGEAELEDVQFICNTTDDASLLLDGEDDSLTTPSTEYNCLSSDDIERLNALNMLRDSPNLGYDIFVEAVTTIRM